MATSPDESRRRGSVFGQPISLLRTRGFTPKRARFTYAPIARLDGLGALGDREHAPGEWIDVRELPHLVKRAALLIHRLAH